MKLLRELIVEEVQILEEAAESGEKKLYITGPFIQYDILNKNKRIYPKAICENAVSKYVDSHIKGKRAWGELGHPQGPIINLDRVCHRIVALEDNKGCYFGKALITDTPHGNIVKGLLKSGGTLGVSSRAVGSVKESNGANYVQEDLHFSTAGDVVADPSAPDAYVDSIMENKEWIWDNGVLVECVIAEHRDIIKKAPSKQLQEAKVAVFKQFLSKL